MIVIAVKTVTVGAVSKKDELNIDTEGEPTVKDRVMIRSLVEEFWGLPTEPVAVTVNKMEVNNVRNGQ